MSDLVRLVSTRRRGVPGERGARGVRGLRAVRDLAQRLRTVGAAACRSLDAGAGWWLGYALPTPERALSQAGWSPNPRAAYCPRCGESIGPGETTALRCAACRDGTAVADGFVRLDAYTDEMRQWIVAIKYGPRWGEMGECLGRRLGRAVLEAGVVDRTRAIVVPMPMPWPRRAARGIDHARVIAWGVARTLDAPLLPILWKANGPPQVALARSARLRSGAKRMGVRHRPGLVIPGRPWRARAARGRASGWKLDGLHAIIVDDVRTTGASLRAAVRRLRPLGPDRVVAAVLAVADDPARQATRSPYSPRALGQRRPARPPPHPGERCA